MELEKNTTPAGALQTQRPNVKNMDEETVAGFGLEWAAFDQSQLTDVEKKSAFDTYFYLFPWEKLPRQAVGADIGCGSGRWASLVSPRVGELLACDPSVQALGVARKNLQSLANVKYFLADAGNLPVADESLDFSYSLGVLHHVPDTQLALNAIAKKLKPGAPFLLYLYYAFDGAPLWFRMLWRITDLARTIVCELPFPLRKLVTDTLATFVYWPLARAAYIAEIFSGRSFPFWPLSYYRDKSFYVMRTDSLDRFGTKLERRFTREQIVNMLCKAGFKDIEFSQMKPLWTSISYRA